uniref:Uncharacterized protein n=1 Tax=Poecilia formosa TaxID=48698 RepID=A0A087YGJ1_POEFO
MYKCYQPFNPVASRFLQQKWEFRRYSTHLHKVQFAHPVVDTRRVLTSANSQYKMKRLQVSKEKAKQITMKDNRLLASRMANIKGTVDHRNEYRRKSLNAGKRKQDLMVISEGNQAMYQRLLSRKSVYSREHWLGDWEKTERLLKHMSRYPKEQAAKQ